jgi:hypothetical protein
MFLDCMSALSRNICPKPLSRIGTFGDASPMAAVARLYAYGIAPQGRWPTLPDALDGRG